MNVSNQNGSQEIKDNIEGVTCKLLNEGKKKVNELYEEGVNKVNCLEDNVKECSDKVLKKIQENPLTSVLIAGGIGFLLSKLIKK